MRMGPSTMPRASRGLLKWLSHMPEQVGDISTAGYTSACVLCVCFCVCVHVLCVCAAVAQWQMFAAV